MLDSVFIHTIMGEDMNIIRLNLRNYRSFPELEVYFQPIGVNVLVGVNGAGKSTVLDAIGSMMQHMVARLKTESGRGAPIAEADIMVGANEASISLCFEENGDTYSFEATGARRGYSRVNTVSRFTDLAKWSASYRDARSQGKQVIYPLLAHYRVNRVVDKVPKRQKALDNADPLNGYIGSLSGQGDFRHFFAWYREQEDYENEQLRENRSYRDQPLEAVRCALGAVLPQLENIHITRRPQAMVATKGGKRIEISQLSDGEKCYMALVGDIACRLARFHEGTDHPADSILASPGIVLIDELDLHLHPQWQREAIRKLPVIFPGIQFIITTHSPQMIGEVNPERVQYLTAGKPSTDMMPTSIGMTSGEILEQHMGSSELSEDARKLADRVLCAINAGDIPAARVRLDEFCQALPNARSLPLYATLLAELEFMS